MTSIREYSESKKARGFGLLPVTFLVLLAIGALLRVAAIELRPPGAVSVAPDEPEYLEIARNIAGGSGFSLHGAPTAYRDMLFPFWAALKGSVIGLPHGVLYAQLVADLLTALLLFLLVRRRVSERAAILAAGIWLLYPAAILITALFLTETIFVFLWVLAMFVFDRIQDRTAVRGYLLLGLVLGLLMLARSTGVILLAAVLILLVYRRRWVPTAVVLGVAFLTVLPWMLRNAGALGTFALNTNSGINLYIGNNPYATGAYRFDQQVTAPLDSADGGEAAYNRRATELAFDYWRSHPVDALALWPRKLAYFWSTDMSLWAHYRPEPGLSLTAQLHRAPVVLLVFTGLFYMLLAAGGMAGIILVRETPLRSLLLLQIGLAVASALATYGLARYHYPLMPALVLGAVSLRRPGAWSTASGRQRIITVFVLGVLFLIWLAEAWTILAG